MATHYRVLKIRAEAGIRTPPRPCPPEQEAEAERSVRLDNMQKESLGSKRRELISSEDFPENRPNLLNWRKLDAARLSNKPGTKENEEFQDHHASMKAWNSAWQDLEDDGTMEEQFIDIEHGQAHRAKLMSDLAYGEEQTAPSLRRHHADDGGRARGGGRGGRGGGFAGSRSRAIGLRRIAVGIPTPLRHLGTATQASLPPHEEGDHTSGARSLIRGGSQSHGSLVPARGGASKQGLSTPTRSLASPSRLVKPPRESSWELRLAADSSLFMKASKEILALSSDVDPVAKSNTAPAELASVSMAKPLTTMKGAAQVASSSYPTSSTSVKRHATTDALSSTSASHLITKGVAEASTAPSTPVSSIKTKTNAKANAEINAGAYAEASTAPPTPTSNINAKSNVEATAEANAEPTSSAARITKHRKTRESSWKVSIQQNYPESGPWAQRPVDLDPGWPPVSGGRGRDTGSSLIDVGDASNKSRDETFSHKTGGGAKALLTVSTSPPRSEKSYSGDLVGLDIQPDAGQTRATQELPSNSSSRTSSTPSFADIHTQLSSLVQALKEALQPELIKSYESIITELEVRSRGAGGAGVAGGAASTPEVAPEMEPPVEAFGRLSIRDDASVPKPISKDTSTALVDTPVVVKLPPPPKVDVSILITETPSTIGSRINQIGYLGRMAAAPKPAVAALATTRPNDVSTGSTSVFGTRSTVKVPVSVEPRGQHKTNQSISAATSMIVEADKLDKVKEAKEAYPLDAILTTTFVPTGPSMLNRGGFYTR